MLADRVGGPEKAGALGGARLSLSSKCLGQAKLKSFVVCGGVWLPAARSRLLYGLQTQAGSTEQRVCVWLLSRASRCAWR